jgi:HK97 family phage prohead protease
MGEFETRACLGELRVEQRGLAKFLSGYAIVWDRLSEDLGGFREQIASSAIDRTLADKVDLRALVDHDPGKVIGRISAGTLRVEKDGHGLKVQIDPPMTSAGQDLVESVRRGDVTGMSFSFRTMLNGDVWDFKTDPPTRTVIDMLVREVSAVSWPAYTQTEVAMRSLAGARETALKGRPVTVSDRIAWSATRKFWPAGRR